MKNILITITLLLTLNVSAQGKNPFKKGNYITVYDSGGNNLFEGFVKEETYKNLPIHRVLIIRVRGNNNTRVYKIIKTGQK